MGVNKRRTREIFLEAYPALDFEDFDARVRERFLALYGGGRLPVKPGAREILTALKARGVPLALASSTRTETVRRELGEAGLLGFFDLIVGGDAVIRSKPDPEIFLTAAARLGAQPGECFVIEDSFNGIRAARAGGFLVFQYLFYEDIHSAGIVPRFPQGSKAKKQRRSVPCFRHYIRSFR